MANLAIGRNEPNFRVREYMETVSSLPFDLHYNEFIVSMYSHTRKFGACFSGWEVNWNSPNGNNDAGNDVKWKTDLPISDKLASDSLNDIEIGAPLCCCSIENERK